MHSGPLDSNGSPRKRTLSRGISEDESLRSIINEQTEGSSRRLTRSESRPGTLKRTSDSQQSDQDLSMGLPEMLELQASYDEVVQELRGLEVEREALLFQVDVLQDTLESVEELLAEAQREAGQASVELEREREAKTKLESMVCSLVEEVERLKQERNNKASAQAIAHGVDDEVAGQQGQKMKSAACSEENDSLQGESSGKEAEEDDGSVLTKLRKMVSKPLIHVPSLALENPVSLDGVFWRPYQNGVEEAQDPSAEQNDSDGAYEDASADTPEQDRLFPGEADPPELQHDSEIEEKCSVSSNQDDKTQDPKPNEQCVVS